MKFPMRIRALFVVLAGVIFYVGIYFWGAHSDGYKFLDQTIRNAPRIHERLGEVQAVRLGFFGGYRDKTVGSKEWVTMTLHVTGQKGAATVVAAARSVNGAWSVTDASIDGEPVSLN